MRKGSAFRQADLQRALRGAHAGGLVVAEIRLTVDGEIRILAGEGRGSSDLRDTQDEIARYLDHARA